jgi:hypothetical protein
MSSSGSRAACGDAIGDELLAAAMRVGDFTDEKLQLLDVALDPLFGQ